MAPTSLYQRHQDSLVMAYRADCEQSRREPQDLADVYGRMIEIAMREGAAEANRQVAESSIPDGPGVSNDVQAAATAPRKVTAMAKGQRRSNKELRKPKANPPRKNNVSNPSSKPQGLSAVASTLRDQGTGRG